MNDNFYTLQQVLELIRYDLIGASANVVWVGQSIFAIGALMYLAKLAYEGMLGSSLFSMKLFRVFGIAILLSLYPQFMLVIDSIMMGINNSLGATYIDGDYRVTDILKTRDLDPQTDNDDNLIGIEDIHAEEEAEAAGLVDQLTEAVSTSLDVTRWIGQKLYWAMMRMAEEILFRISQAMLMIINAIRVFFLVVLYVVGPLILAASAFPGFESVFLKWLGRYLSVHLWLGIGNIFESIAVRLWRIIVENGGLWASGIGLEGSVNSVILTSWSWVFLMTLIVGYICIPIVAGWVISSAGMGQAGALLTASLAKHATRGGLMTANEALHTPRYRR